MAEQIAATKIAMAFHEAYERLAPRFSYETRVESAVPWEDVPQRNQALMIATVSDLLDRGVIRKPSHTLTAEDHAAGHAEHPFDFDEGPIVGYCSKCGEVRFASYTCRDGGHTIEKSQDQNGEPT